VTKRRGLPNCRTALILLDANVLSEPFKLQRSEAVIAWLDAQDPSVLCTSSVMLAELLAGIAIKPDGRRKDQLAADVRRALVEQIGTRVYDFDSAAAESYSDIARENRLSGLTLPLADALTAAVACSRGLAVATRNVRHFEPAGVTISIPGNTVAEPSGWCL